MFGVVHFGFMSLESTSASWKGRRQTLFWEELTTATGALVAHFPEWTSCDKSQNLTGIGFG